jgi:DNA invertase Pin-like site-specific DNA recombinase
MNVYGFIRISTGSQDAQTQETTILKAYPDALIIRPDSKAASASKGQQLDALDGLIAKLAEGDLVIVTDSSRLDRRDNLTSQIQTMLAIRGTGARIVSLAPGEESFAQGDDLGGWITTIVKQSTNADKSKTVKTQTHRGITQIADNKAMFGSVPRFWAVQGERYAKQAVCIDPEAVKDIYRRIGDRHPVLAVAREYSITSQALRTLISFEANSTGVIQCRFETKGLPVLEWAHTAEAVVTPEAWQAANEALAENHVKELRAKGGRPVAKPSQWISGILDCPGCGGKTYLHTQKSHSGTMLTKFRCGGKDALRKACGIFTGTDAQPVIDAITQYFTEDTTTEVLAYQRVTGNRYQLSELRGQLAKVQARLSMVTDRAERREAVARIEALEDDIDGFAVVPDTFDYTPTGQTISGMFTSGDETVKRSMAKAVKASGGIWLTEDGVRIVRAMPGKLGDVINLGGGLCYRRTVPSVLMTEEAEEA